MPGDGEETDWGKDNVSKARESKSVKEDLLAGVQVRGYFLISC